MRARSLSSTTTWIAPSNIDLQTRIARSSIESLELGFLTCRVDV